MVRIDRDTCMMSALMILALCIGAAVSSEAGLRLDITPTVIHTTSDAFRMISVNMDFWPSTKDKWQNASALTFNVSNPDFIMLAAALGGSGLRLGGSPADTLLYDVLSDGSACSQSNLNKTQPQNGPHGYYCPIWDQCIGQCLTMQRWKELLQFASSAALHLILDLNACWLRAGPTSGMNWDLIDGLLETTAGQPWSASLWGLEFGNELYDNVAATQYGADIVRLAAKVSSLWGPGQGPVLAGPDSWEADLSPSYYRTVLAAAAPTHALHALTFHDYGDDCSGDVTAALGLVLNVSCLDSFINSSQWVVSLSEQYGVPVWNGESALHSDSGVDGLTNTFVSSLWYAYELGAYAAAGVGLLSRQTLVGGDYELIDKVTVTPHPDYYVALLWKRLVGSQVLMASLSPFSQSSSVRAYAQCAHGGASQAPHGGAGIVAVLVNFAVNTTDSVTIDWGNDGSADQVAVYQLQPLAGPPAAGTHDWTGLKGTYSARPTDWYGVALNGKPLTFASGGPVPDTPPVMAAASAPVSLGPATVTLVVNAGAGAGVCSGK